MMCGKVLRSSIFFKQQETSLMPTGTSMVAGSLSQLSPSHSICPLLGHLGDLTSEQKGIVGIVIKVEYTHLMTHGSELSKTVNSAVRNR